MDEMALDGEDRFVNRFAKGRVGVIGGVEIVQCRLAVHGQSDLRDVG